MLCCEQFGEWTVDLVADDFFVCNEDVFEDGLVEFAADFVARVQVEDVWVLKQFQVGFKEGSPFAEIVRHCVQFDTKFFSLPADVREACADLPLRQCAVGGEVEEVFLFGVEADELVFELFAEQSLRGFGVREGGFHSGADGGDEFCGEADCLVVLFDRGFDPVDVRVRGVADVVLDSSAEEVVILAALPSDCALQDEPFDDLAFEPTASAVEGAFQVVRVHPASFPRSSSGGEEALDPFEEFVGDQLGMSALVLFALEGHFPQVVAVAEQLRDFVDRDRPGRAADVSGHGQAAVGEFAGDVVEGVVARRIQFERECDEWCSLLVEGDGSDFSSFEAFDGVQVAQRCASEGAAVLGFLPHLVGDVCPVFAGSVFIERGEDAVHELPDRGFVDRLGGADQADAAFGEVGHDDSVVVAVPGEARKLVDDDVVDVFLAPHAGQHLLERDSFGHLRRGAARLDILVHDRQAELIGFLLARDSLGRNGNALGVIVSVDLPLRRDSKVDDGASARCRVDE